jgi:hydroxymethylglutaryl-CoA lyase
MANPAQIRRVYKLVEKEIGHVAGLHIHNTRGLGLANVLAGLDIGVRTFDASLAGLGGCPFAPGASGNIVTEDLVFLLESMGLDTGVDLEKLIAARAIFKEALPGEPIYGHVPDAGLPKAFRRAADQAGA